MAILTAAAFAAIFAAAFVGSFAAVFAAAFAAFTTTGATEAEPFDDAAVVDAAVAGDAAVVDAASAGGDAFPLCLTVNVIGVPDLGVHTISFLLEAISLYYLPLKETRT